MAGEIPTLILTVDLDCHLCDKKIKKVLCKLQGPENIQTIAYDKEKKEVTISGPFDPIKLKKKLRCKACIEIKDIKIKEKPKPDEIVTNPPEPPKESTDKKAEPVCLQLCPVGLIGPAMPACCCRRPCYVGCHDGCRCCSCGCTAAWPPPQMAVSKPITYQFSCDCEEVPPPCSIM